MMVAVLVSIQSSYDGIPITETCLRLLKQFILLAAELAFLFFGLMFSLGFAVYLGSVGSKFAPIVFLTGLSLICAAHVWFRHKTGKWTVAADATAWLAHRSWRQLHPRRAKYLRSFQLSLLLFPSFCSAFALFFFPVASHILFSGTHLIPHYRVSTPLNWLIIKSRGDIEVWTVFSNQGAARYGFTPVWFNHSMPSSAIFLTSGPASTDGWRLPERELASGHTTHLAEKRFQLGTITATCYEYRHSYSDAADRASSISTSPAWWESLCSTKPNGVDYNLRVAFSGQREDMPAFYDVLSTATPSN